MRAGSWRAQVGASQEGTKKICREVRGICHKADRGANQGVEEAGEGQGAAEQATHCGNLFFPGDHEQGVQGMQAWAGGLALCSSIYQLVQVFHREALVLSCGSGPCGASPSSALSRVRGREDKVLKKSKVGFGRAREKVKLGGVSARRLQDAAENGHLPLLKLCDAHPDACCSAIKNKGVRRRTAGRTVMVWFRQEGGPCPHSCAELRARREGTIRSATKISVSVAQFLRVAVVGGSADVKSLGKVSKKLLRKEDLGIE